MVSGELYDFEQFKRRRDTIVKEIVQNYYIVAWVSMTGNRHLDDRSEKIVRLHRKFEYLGFCIYPITGEQAEMQLAQLESVRDALKIEYQKLENQKRAT